MELDNDIDVPEEVILEASIKRGIGEALHELENKITAFIKNNNLKDKCLIYKGMQMKKNTVKVAYGFKEV